MPYILMIFSQALRDLSKPSSLESFWLIWIEAQKVTNIWTTQNLHIWWHPHTRYGCWNLWPLKLSPNIYNLYLVCTLKKSLWNTNLFLFVLSGPNPPSICHATYLWLTLIRPISQALDTGTTWFDSSLFYEHGSYCSTYFQMRRPVYPFLKH